ncbi:MAG: hypothetical protein RLZZ373_2651 [Pseudomonadota bacterium]
MEHSNPPTAVGSNAGLGLRAWLLERYESAMAIAARKATPDKAEWMADAAYFKAAVKALDGRADAIAAEREKWRELAQRVAHEGNARGLEGLKVRCTIGESGAVVSWEVDRRPNVGAKAPT